MSESRERVGVGSPYDVGNAAAKLEGMERSRALKGRARAPSASASIGPQKHVAMLHASHRRSGVMGLELIERNGRRQRTLRDAAAMTSRRASLVRPEAVLEFRR